jgi:hypothetical protein
VIRIVHADILQRPVGKNAFGFVGTVYLSHNEDFKGNPVLKEGPSYLLDNRSGSPSILPNIIGYTPDYYGSLSIGNLLTMPVWNPTTEPGIASIRLMPMGGGEDGFIVYGANKLPLFDQPLKDDCMARYRNGQWSHKDARPELLRGQCLDQALNNSGMFTNQSGENLYLPTLSSPARCTMLDIQAMRFKVIDGQLTEDDFVSWSQKDGDRHSLAVSGGLDKDFLAYIDGMRKHNALGRGYQCVTKTEYDRTETIAKKVMREIHERENGDSPSP